ncbi:MAG: hypothetical protein ACRDZX_13830 [Acidimicrobiales bacterium]
MTNRPTFDADHGIGRLQAVLEAWGAFDQGDPFPLFAEVRELGPVHPVTLADGNDAWLVIGHDEARHALNDPRFSKDIHSALALRGVGGGRGTAGTRVRPARARSGPTRPHPAVSSGVVGVPDGQGEDLRPRVQATKAAT